MLRFSIFAEFLKELISLKVLNELYILKTNKNSQDVMSIHYQIK